MDTERLGIDLGNLIVETSDKSTKEIEDIISPLGTMNNNILFEYVALLLWGATKAASNVLPEEPSKRVINVAFTAVFEALNELKDDPEFNIIKSWQLFKDFIHDRFDQYYAAWNDNPTGEGDEKFRRNLYVVVCFIQCCFADTAEFIKIVNEDKSSITNVLSVVGHHYCSFAERVRSTVRATCPVHNLAVQGTCKRSKALS